MSEEARRASETANPFPWLTRNSLSASVFFAGPLCGSQDYADDGRHGLLHLVRRGPARLFAPVEAPLSIARPSLVLFARPRAHRMEADEARGADLLCARLAFAEAEAGLLLLGFPDCLVIPLDELPGLEPVLGRLFDEAFAPAFGQRAALDLLTELLMVMLLRHCVERGLTARGLLAGLADPKLARVLAALHDAPQSTFTLERLAAIAGMSRSSFAAAFKARIGLSPGDYLGLVRLTLARQALLAGRPLKAAAAEVGYTSTTALSRAFRRQFGSSPRAWLARQQQPGDPG